VDSREHDLVARVDVTVAAATHEVWQALVEPDAIRQYMFGTTVTSDWREGSSITWAGEWQGRAYEDKGAFVRLQPGRLLEYTHVSPPSGAPDEPADHHTVTVELTPVGGGRTRVTLTQDGNATPEAREHAERNWRAMLDALRDHVERRERGAA
jgi:uncharacterized protein YndB with AHSA1/START domain